MLKNLSFPSWVHKRVYKSLAKCVCLCMYICCCCCFFCTSTNVCFSLDKSIRSLISCFCVTDLSHKSEQHSHDHTNTHITYTHIHIHKESTETPKKHSCSITVKTTYIHYLSLFHTRMLCWHASQITDDKYEHTLFSVPDLFGLSYLTLMSLKIPLHYPPYKVLHVYLSSSSILICLYFYLYVHTL